MPRAFLQTPRVGHVALSPTHGSARGVASHTRDGTSMDTVTAVLQRIVCSLSSSTPRCLVSLARRYDSHFFDNTSSLFCCTSGPQTPHVEAYVYMRCLYVAYETNYATCSHHART